MCSWPGRTEHDEIQDQDDEPNDSPTGTVLPGIVAAGGAHDVVRDGCGGGEEGQPELGEEAGQGEHLGHGCGGLLLLISVCSTMMGKKVD